MSTEIYQRVRIQGSCMSPLIPRGSIVALSRMVPVTPRAGELLAHRQERGSVVRRVLESRSKGNATLVRLKGDGELRSLWLPARKLTHKAVWTAQGAGRRRLDIEPENLRVRLLTRLSRLEADLAEALLGPVGEDQQDRGSPAPGRLERALGLLVWMPKRAGVLLLRSAYPRSSARDFALVEAYLLSCFRALNGLENPASLPPPPGLDWDDFLQRAQEHGLLPQIVPLLAEIARHHEIPRHLAAEVKARRRHGVYQHLAGSATLGEIEEALAPIGLPYAVLKGPALTLALYPEGRIRSFGDIDLLVRRRDRERALSALAADRFTFAGGRLTRALVRRGHFHMVLEPNRRGRLKVELHWSLVDRGNLYRIDDDEVFERLRRVRKGDLEASVLSVEDELIYLGIHVMKHGVLNSMGLANDEPAEWFCGRLADTRLLWYQDIQRLLEVCGEEIDWRRVEETAKRWNTLEDLVLCLRVLDRLLPSSRGERALARLERESRIAPDGPGLLGRLYRTRLGHSLIERLLVVHPEVTLRPVRLLFLGRLLLPSPARLLGYHGKHRTAWLPLLYLIHPLNILRKQIS